MTTQDLILSSSQANALANVFAHLNNVGGKFKRIDLTLGVYVLNTPQGFKVCRYNPGGVLVSKTEIYKTQHDFLTAYGL